MAYFWEGLTIVAILLGGAVAIGFIYLAILAKGFSK